MVGRITASTLVYILTLGAGERFSLHAKRDFAGIIKLRALINEEITLGHPSELDTVMCILKSRELFQVLVRKRIKEMKHENPVCHFRH